jgi:peptide deformylase
VAGQQGRVDVERWPVEGSQQPRWHELTVGGQQEAIGREVAQDGVTFVRADAPGIGLAANQIGVPLQVAIIELEEKVTELINPQIVRASGEIVDWEGCLSIPGFVAEVTRSAKVTVKAKNRHGKEFRVKGEELFARALQHEIDHLNGVLYIDYLESLEELVRVSEHSEIEEETTAGI